MLPFYASDNNDLMTSVLRNKPFSKQLDFDEYWGEMKHFVPKSAC